MNTATSPALQGHLTDLADPTRGRILLALEEYELSVTELQSVLQLPQSTVSRHLKVLADGGWVARRSEGPSHRYRLAPNGLPAVSRELWALVRAEVAAERSAREDRERLRAVLAERHLRSREFFASEAGAWDRLRGELFGRRTDLLPLLGLLDPDQVVGDLGCGTGSVAALLSPFVGRVVAVDESEEMLRAARGRLAGAPNVEIRQGALERLPVHDTELDVALLVLVLPYVPEPGAVAAEAARALRPGGRLVVVDIRPHDRTEYEHTMGHLWLGFAPAQIQEWMRAAGLGAGRVLPLPADPEARGPGLFVASARKTD
jgi:SAM-dependent methyltransferase